MTRGDRKKQSRPDTRRTAGNVIDRLRAALGGTVKVSPGVDLTEPTGEIWQAQVQEKSSD
jgi:hypothetical protein